MSATVMERPVEDLSTMNRSQLIEKAFQDINAQFQKTLKKNKFENANELLGGSSENFRQALHMLESLGWRQIDILKLVIGDELKVEDVSGEENATLFVPGPVEHLGPAERSELLGRAKAALKDAGAFTNDDEEDDFVFGKTAPDKYCELITKLSKIQGWDMKEVAEVVTGAFGNAPVN